MPKKTAKKVAKKAKVAKVAKKAKVTKVSTRETKLIGSDLERMLKVAADSRGITVEKLIRQKLRSLLNG